MPTKPTNAEIMSEKVMKSNPEFAKDALEAIINSPDCTDMRNALLDAGLVEKAENQ